MPAGYPFGRVAAGGYCRALTNKPSIIFADKSTKNLDSETGNKVLALLVNGIRRYHRAMVMVPHNMDIAKQPDVIVKWMN